MSGSAGADAYGGRPKGSAIGRLAASMLAQELMARIPEYASYAEGEGLETLTGIVRELTRGYARGRGLEDGIATQLEAATMVGAPGRTRAVVSGYRKIHEDAAVLLEGGWIREVGLRPPFEGNFAKVEVLRSNFTPLRGYAFRHADLDARGLAMFVETRGGNLTGVFGQIVRWEKISAAEAVPECDQAQVAARHERMTRLAAKAREEAATQPAEIVRSFAEAEFQELASPDRRTMLLALANELSHGLENGDAAAVQAVLNKLAGVSAAVDAIADPSQIMSAAPEEPRRPRAVI